MRSPTLPDARERAALGVIVALALALRLALIQIKGPRAYFGDTAEYDLAARSLLAGHGIAGGIPRAPLYPACMALAYTLFGAGNLMAVRIAQLPLAAGVVLLTARLASEGGARAALLAAAAAAFTPTLVYTSTMLYPTGLYTLLMLGITVLALNLGREPGLRAGAALGACFALAWFTDQVVIVPIAAVMGWLASRLRVHGWRLAGPLALALLVALTVVIPVTGWRQRTGTPGFFLAKAEYVLYVARHDTVAVGGHALRDTSRAFAPLAARDFLRREAGYLLDRPGDYLHDVGYEFVHFFSPYPDRITTPNRFTAPGARWLVAISFLPVVPLALLGLIGGAAPRHERVLLAVVPLAAAASYAVLFSQVRYRVPVEPQLLALASLGVDRLARARASRSTASAHPGS